MMLDFAATVSTKAEPDPTARSSVAGTFAIVVPWPPAAEGGVNQVVINLYKEIARTGPYQPLIFVTDGSGHAHARVRR